MYLRQTLKANRCPKAPTKLGKVSTKMCCCLVGGFRRAGGVSFAARKTLPQASRARIRMAASELSAMYAQWITLLQSLEVNQLVRQYCFVFVHQLGIETQRCSAGKGSGRHFSPFSTQRESHPAERRNRCIKRLGVGLGLFGQIMESVVGVLFGKFARTGA